MLCLLPALLIRWRTYIMTMGTGKIRQLASKPGLQTPAFPAEHAA